MIEAGCPDLDTYSTALQGGKYDEIQVYSYSPRTETFPEQ
jgi:hypothetical protein